MSINSRTGALDRGVNQSGSLDFSPSFQYSRAALLNLKKPPDQTPLNLKRKFLFKPDISGDKHDDFHQKLN
jgi:hypothetical protein